MFRGPCCGVFNMYQFSNSAKKVFVPCSKIDKEGRKMMVRRFDVFRWPFVSPGKPRFMETTSGTANGQDGGKVRGGDLRNFSTLKPGSWVSTFNKNL